VKIKINFFPSATIKAIELSLVTRNPHGQLRCYSLNLVDFLDTTCFSPRLHLKYNWIGHQHAISNLYQTQKNRFCTIGIDGQINVWKYELREVKLVNWAGLVGEEIQY
jgi:hypothetical protein